MLFRSMEHIAALLLIVGCSGDLNECRELPAPVPVFETVEQCREELVVARAVYRGDAEHVVATCVDVDPAMEDDEAELVWDINPDGTLYAAIDVGGDVMVAANPDRPEKTFVSQEQ